MSPCSPNDISIDPPSVINSPSIAGFGTPGAINSPNINPFPDGFPEDLLNILDTLQLLVPPGVLKPSLNLNFGKDIFDGIMKLLDQFMPFLMMYKFFLPVLNMVVCIIEVICAIPNPFKLPGAIIKLFTNCIPAFLNLFPAFAMIIMAISLLLLLLALVEYIIEQLLKFIQIILKNINMLNSAFQEANANSVLAITKKLGSVLCIFQNLFVLLSIFTVIIQVIKDILKLAFPLPPCDDGNTDGCCTPEVCPNIVKNPYTRESGTLQYLNAANAQTSVVLPPPMGNLTVPIRTESWQLFDGQQSIAQRFLNIIDGYDVPTSSTTNPPPFFKPIFFPTDATYTLTTSPKQAAYTIDLRVFYNPINWGRTGVPRFIRFKDCIVITVPSTEIVLFDNSTIANTTGVLSIVGGLGYEDDGTTILTGFASDGISPITKQATLNNFLHQRDLNSITPVLSSTDGYTFTNIEYSFKPNLPILLNKNLITLGCLPDVSFSKAFINNAFASDASLKSQLLQDLFNDANFPSTDNAQQCLATALSSLRNNLTPQGVAEFQAVSTICLQKLKDDTTQSLSSLISLGFDPCKSNFSIDPSIQFTGKPIKITVKLNENNGISLINNIPTSAGDSLATRLKMHNTFGLSSKFIYDGYQSFTADISSNDPGVGQVMVSFDNNIFCTNTTTPSLTHTLQTLNYQFVYTPTFDSTAQPRRDDGDLARDNIGSS